MKFYKEHITALFCTYPFLVTISSWVHYFTTHSFVVDHNPIQPHFLNILLCGIIAIGFFIHYKKLCQIEKSQEIISYEIIKKIATIQMIIAFLCLPLFSNDFFSLLGYADAYINGHDIYLDFHSASQTRYHEMINPLYSNLNCKYGPINVWLMCLPIYFSNGDIFVNIILSKTVFLVFSIIYIQYALKLIKIQHQYVFLILIPIWSIQGLGQFHNDIIGVSLITLGIYYLHQRKIWLCYLFLILAVMTKLTFALALIFPIFYTFEKEKKITFKTVSNHSIILLILLPIVTFICYAPFISNVESILAPFKAMSNERPSSTFTDIASYVMLLFNNDLIENAKLAKPIFQVIGLFLMIFTLYRYFLNYKQNTNAQVILLILFTILFFIFSHRFLPWYLMLIPLFSSVTQNRNWMKWTLAICYISMFQDFAIMLGTDTVLGKIIMIISTIFTVGIFFYKLRSRFSLNKNYIISKT